MLLHPSNLIHLGVFLLAFLLLCSVAKDARRKKVRVVSTLIQLSVLLMCVDLMIGVFVIERYYDGVTASWVSKTVMVFPVLLLLSVWRMVRHRKAVATAETTTDT